MSFVASAVRSHVSRNGARRSTVPAVSHCAPTNPKTFWSTPLRGQEEPVKTKVKPKVHTPELIQKIATSHNLSIADSRRIFKTVFDTIHETLAEGKSVSVTKFGIFTTVRTKERTGRNPRTGAAIHIDAKERVRFRPTKYLKEFVQPK